MKIAYLTFGDVNSENGVIKKIICQLRTWQSFGNEVRLFAMSKQENIFSGLAQIPHSTVNGFTKYMRFLRSSRLIDKVIDWQPEIVYVRWSNCWPYLGKLFDNITSVIEINSYDVTEFKSTQSRLDYYYHLINRSRLLKKTAGMVTVTNELADNFREFCKPMLVLANGINLSELPQLKPCNNPTPRLVLIGYNRHAWTGVDKFLVLAERFPSWQFDFIGEMKGLNSPPNVTNHGYLNQIQIQEVLSKADIGIGTLALHRKQMQEACALKVREYLAYGLPSIIGYNDTDLTASYPWLLKLPNTEDNIVSNLNDIETFANNMKGRRIPRKDIEHLDVLAKEEKRLRFFKTVLSNT